MKNIDTNQVWKQKYYDSLDELETKEKLWTEIESLLRNVVIKMSLALDGIDDGFDQQLSELRQIFRAQPGQLELKQIITSLTDSLDDIDQAKQFRQKDENRIRQLLLDMIESLQFPGKFAKAAKALRKEIAASETTDHLQSIIEQLQVLLQATLNHYQQKAQTADNRGGLFSRLFQSQKNNQSLSETDDELNTNSGTNNVKNNTSIHLGGDLVHAKSENQQVSNLQSGIDVLRLIMQKLRLPNYATHVFDTQISKLSEINSGQALLELGDELVQIINRFQTPQRSRDNTSVLPELGPALISLLDKMSLPEKLNDEIAELQEILQQEVKVQQWPELLERIANLVASLRENIQQEKLEFENYLANLTRRLQEIDNALRGVDSNRRLAHEQCIQLDEAMSREVADIRQQIKDRSEIEPLKLAIENRLDAIVVHMQQYRSGEESRSQQAEQTIIELTQRLQVLESESKELKKKVVRQRELAMLDRLTGIPNRMAYDERLKQEYRRWRRFHEHLCLMIIDIDLFKKINDNYGHKAGDRVLAKVAQVINSKIRETDYLARYGGEEFTVLITGAMLKDALRVGDKIREAVADCGFHFRKQAVPVTISAGLAQFADNDTPEDVFERADQALYKAKNSGRNCCCIQENAKQ